MQESPSTREMYGFDSKRIARERERLITLRSQVNPEAARQIFDDLFKSKDTEQLDKLAIRALSDQARIRHGLKYVMDFTSRQAKHLEQQTANWTWFERDMLKKRTRESLQMIEAAKAYREIEKEASAAFDLQNSVIEGLTPRYRELVVYAAQRNGKLDEFLLIGREFETSIGPSRSIGPSLKRIIMFNYLNTP